MKRANIRWLMVFYDWIVLLAVELLLVYFYQGTEALTLTETLIQVGISALCIFSARLFTGAYLQIWRYGGIQCYIRLMTADCVGFILNLLLEKVLPITHISFARLVSICAMNLLLSLAIRMLYRYAYKCGNSQTFQGRALHFLLRVFAGSKVVSDKQNERRKIKVAIIGAGRLGVALAEELRNNVAAAYTPRCFVDTNAAKVNRQIFGLPVLAEDDSIFNRFHELDVQEVVFAVPSLEEEKRKSLYEFYAGAGYQVKIYDYPVFSSGSEKRQLRMYDIEDLLFRKTVDVRDPKTGDYYRDKVILITGGGGSIGSELCRQLAAMEPRKIIVLDIYENGAYDLQQELKIAYGSRLELEVEIVSICNRAGMESVFQTHRPQIVIHAAAHKHVPLMEHNCIEAIVNNVFGTQLLVELCEAYKAERFLMVSTDKAVNPTNVMGATKRMCEMIVLNAASWGSVQYSATRFGNVLGSAGSVIPLFKKQIANGGPITLTDRRIIRYFMTIPEASQLVLQSGAMAKNGELFVLDMGKPVKILDLAENLIRLSGATGIDIVETGLRPGEKLYEELLVNTEVLDKTDNKLIFIERDAPVSKEAIAEKLALLRQACDTGSNEVARDALKQAVPTYKAPSQINEVVNV